MSYYKNDLKYKKFRNINLNSVYQSDPDLFKDYEDMDTLEYRIKKCLETGGRSLDLSHLDLITFPKKVPKNIYFLFCSNNKFTEIPDLSYLKKLRIIDLSYNNIIKLPHLPHTIVEISCRNNSIKNIDIKKYNKLKRLDFSYNNTSIIKSLNNVEVVECINNNLTKLPSSNKIKYLRCRYNKLENIVKYPNLEYLDCGNNIIKMMDTNKKLMELYCECNEIKKLDLNDNIEIIHCHENSINKIEYYKNLKELVCDYTKELKIDKNYNNKKLKVEKYKTKKYRNEIIQILIT